MISLILMLYNKMQEADILGIILASSWLIYIILFLVVKANRKKKQIKSAIYTGIAATLVLDVVWLFTLFEDFKPKEEMTIGDVFWILALPAVLLILVMALSYINVNVDAHEKKKLAKEHEKLRKKESKKAKYVNSKESDKQSKTNAGD